ncbi:MAG: flagellar protein FlaG [Pseudomonadota bacterium]
MSTELLSMTPNSYATAVSKPAVVLPFRSQPSPAPAEAEAVSDDDAPLTQAVAELNRYVAGTRTDLRFAVDNEAGKLVVSIIDAENGQVLRQMPSLEALRIARYLEHDRLGLIRQRA